MIDFFYQGIFIIITTKGYQGDMNNGIDNNKCKASPIVTLTTDWGDRQFFSGMVKGALSSLIENVRIMDITHHVTQFNVQDAAFIVKRACTGFPPGTIHLIDVATQPPYIAVKAYNQYYLCCDNDFPQQAFGDDIDEVCSIPYDPQQTGTFASYTIFPEVAAKLASGTTLMDVGQPYVLKDRLSTCHYAPLSEGCYIVYIRFVDSYGNAYLSISEEEFETLRQGHKFFFDVRSAFVREKMEAYYDNPPSLDSNRRFRLTVSASGNMELSISGASFSQLMGRKVNESVILKIKDE